MQGQQVVPLPLLSGATHIFHSFYPERYCISMHLMRQKFRGRGNKEGAKLAWQSLEEAGLGTFTTKKAARGTTQVVVFTVLAPKYKMDFLLFTQLYEFQKAPIPEGDEEKAKFVEKLMDIGVSLSQYREAYAMADITM